MLFQEIPFHHKDFIKVLIIHSTINLSQKFKTTTTTTTTAIKIITKTIRIINLPNIGLCHRVKLKESEKKYKYLDLARELKKLWNM